VLLRRQHRVVVRQVLFAARVARHAEGVLGGDVVARHRPPIVRDEVEAVDAQRVEDADELLGRAGVGVVPRSLVGLAVSLEIGCDQSEPPDEPRHDATPLVPAVGNAVQQEHYLAVGGAGLDDVVGHQALVARRLDEAVGERHPVQHLDVAVPVRVARLHVAEAFDLGIEAGALALHKFGEGLDGPIGQRRISERLVGVRLVLGASGSPVVGGRSTP